MQTWQPEEMVEQMSEDDKIKFDHEVKEAIDTLWSKMGDDSIRTGTIFRDRRMPLDKPNCTR